MVIYRSSGTVVADVPQDMQNQPCLSKEEVLEIARISLEVEKHFNTPQEMEWAVDLDLPFPQNVFWVQARPAEFPGKKQLLLEVREGRMKEDKEILRGLS